MAMRNNANIVLIGMPGSGKSTLGKRLATQRGLKFLDADKLIEKDQNLPIQEIVNLRGVRYLRQVEEQVLCTLNCTRTVIATGGSAVFSEAAMAHLGQGGVRLYLRISLPTLLRRVSNVHSRGLAKLPSHPLVRLYTERLPLYAAAADITMDNDWPLTGVRVAECHQLIDEYLSKEEAV